MGAWYHNTIEMTWKNLSPFTHFIFPTYQGWIPNIFKEGIFTKPAHNTQNRNHRGWPPNLGFYEATHQVGETRTKWVTHIHHLPMHDKLNKHKTTPSHGLHNDSPLESSHIGWRWTLQRGYTITKHKHHFSIAFCLSRPS